MAVSPRVVQEAPKNSRSPAFLASMHAGGPWMTDTCVLQQPVHDYNYSYTFGRAIGRPSSEVYGDMLGGTPLASPPPSAGKKNEPRGNTKTPSGEKPRSKHQVAGISVVQHSGHAMFHDTAAESACPIRLGWEEPKKKRVFGQPTNSHQRPQREEKRPRYVNLVVITKSSLDDGFLLRNNLLCGEHFVLATTCASLSRKVHIFFLSTLKQDPLR